MEQACRSTMSMLPKSSSLSSIKDAQEAEQKLDAIIASRVMGSLAVGDPVEAARPSTPELLVETEKEREARRERRRLRRAKKEAEELASRSPRRETNAEAPDKERLKGLARSSSVRVAPAKPLPPLPEGPSAHSCTLYESLLPFRFSMQAPRSIALPLARIRCWSLQSRLRAYHLHQIPTMSPQRDLH